MSQPGWDDVLDGLDHQVASVEAGLDADGELDDLPPFALPTGAMPTMTSAQRCRAEALHQRHAALEHRVAEALLATTADIRDLRRRRRAAVAYTGR